MGGLCQCKGCYQNILHFLFKQNYFLFEGYLFNSGLIILQKTCFQNQTCNFTIKLVLVIILMLNQLGLYIKKDCLNINGN